MTTRTYHADGLRHSLKVLESLTVKKAETQEPTAASITNALGNLKGAIKFLLAEQQAINLLFDVEED